MTPISKIRQSILLPYRSEVLVQHDAVFTCYNPCKLGSLQSELTICLAVGLSIKTCICSGACSVKATIYNRVTTAKQCVAYIMLIKRQTEENTK